MTAATDPSTPSLAHTALADDWAQVRAILAGGASVKSARTRYLPKFGAEGESEYSRRLAAAPWQPEFEDIVRGISAKPFAKAVVLAGEPSDQMKGIAEDVDGRGNNLHVFAKDVFEGAVTLGAHGILVDWPSFGGQLNRREESDAGARPYWVSVDADEILALRTERRGAREVVTHLRLMETAVEVRGFEEIEVRKIRVIEPGQWQVWREVQEANSPYSGWIIEAEGLLTLEEVPFVFLATAERRGPQFVRPPLLGLANMQIELYQQGSNEERIYTLAGSPMLTANGLADPGEPIPVGPGAVLYAPGVQGIQTSWDYIQPDAANLAAISERRRKLAEDMRRLGLQPLVARTGNVTATASGIEAAKGHSAVQTWANALKDALEQAFMFTAKWLRTNEEVEVSVHTDFAVGQFGVEEVKELREARKAGDISQRTYWDELARRGVLGPQFDADAEEQALIDEGDLEGDEDDLRAALPPMPDDQREAGAGTGREAQT